MTAPTGPTRFLIPSLLAAGFGAQDGAQAAFTQATSTGTDDPNSGTLLQTFKQDHFVTLAQHRSHSSHSSHSSHRSGGGGHYSHSSHTSHRSSTGGYDPYPAPAPPPPVYSPPSPPPPPAGPEIPRSTTPPGQLRATPPSETAAPDSTLPALPGRSQRFAAIVRRVQIALMAQGFFEGPITGTVGPVTRAALRRFQAARQLAVTGTITPETLDALRVSSE
ncbi:MAG TPA: peptidoglycan-binding domain-containing protein [Allosphingosinicella sp.]|nr:peptidoglycan-binding domain-containing protein [Allosphingosinicella sp.]